MNNIAFWVKVLGSITSPRITLKIHLILFALIPLSGFFNTLVYAQEMAIEFLVSV
jgi:hypothetical protein